MAITSHTRPHHLTLPSSPLSRKKMLLHPEKHGFLIAAQAEYDGIQLCRYVGSSDSEN
jgi:hypothetical protein